VFLNLLALMERVSSFEDLRRLAHCIEKLDGRTARRMMIRVGGLALPLLLRELASPSPTRAEFARGLLVDLATKQADLFPRAVRSLRQLSATADHRLKTSALGVLGELGVAVSAATWVDLETAQRQRATSLAEQLATDADVAAAADLIIKRLDPDEMISLLEVMIESAPQPAARLVTELSGRVDLEGSVRSEVRRVAAATWLHRAQQTRPTPPLRPRRSSVVTQVMIMTDPRRGSHVVVAGRRVAAQKRWRRFAVLIGADGGFEDCLYEDDSAAADVADLSQAALVRGLVIDGYEMVSNDLERARALAAAAARRAAALPNLLNSSYYLGRDLLDLGNVHMGAHAALDEVAAAIGRAVDLFAAGEVGRARELAQSCAQLAPDNADVASTLGLCHLANVELTGAAQWLGRAAAAEPGWPTHHWNLAVVHHLADCASACADALTDFLRTAADCITLRNDSLHHERIIIARRYLAAHRLAEPATRPRRSRRSAVDPARLGKD
jgi:tetratricopeptide (TPR) repeat protein